MTEEPYANGNLWWLQHSSETGSRSTGADYAWCGGTGQGQAIGIIDTPFMEHRDVIYAGGYSLAQAENSHGLACAGMAAALANGLDVVGIAYDADIYTLEVPIDPTARDIADALDWGIANLPLGAVISLSLAADEGTELLRNAVQAVYAEGIPFFAIRHFYNTYPGAWDQGSPERWVLSVDGSDRDGYAYGAGVADVLAPTEDITVLLSGNQLWTEDNVTGSYAVPQVAAAAARPGTRSTPSTGSLRRRPSDAL